MLPKGCGHQAGVGRDPVVLLGSEKGDEEGEGRQRQSGEQEILLVPSRQASQGVHSGVPCRSTDSYKPLGLLLA